MFKPVGPCTTRRDAIRASRGLRPLYVSAYDRRRRSQGRSALALIVACVVAFGGALAGAAAVDEARGVTVSQSLESVGL